MFTFEKSSTFRRLSTPWQSPTRLRSPTLYNIVRSGIGEQCFPRLCSLMFYSSCFLPFVSSFLTVNREFFVSCAVVYILFSKFFFQVEFNPAKAGRQRSHSSHFQNQTRHLTLTNTNDEGFWFSFHKNYKLGPTHPRLTMFYWQSNTFTSTANTTVLAIRALCKFVFQICPENLINQLWFPEHHFTANGFFLRLGEVQMKIYDRSLQALLSSPLARSCILVQLASLAQIGELAHKLFRRHP